MTRHHDKPRAIRLTPPQVELLGDLATKPQIYVRRYSRWAKTAAALLHRGLAYVSAEDYSDHGMPEYKITDAGRAEAARRGLTPEPASGDRDG